MLIDRDSSILVTGGAGFIGSHLCEYLLCKGYKHIVSLDDYSSGTKNNHIDGVTYISGSTSKIFSLIDFIPDVIFHLGEYSRVEQSFEDFDKVCESNHQGTLNVAKFAIKTGAKLIYAGSSTKFSDKNSGRFQTPYGWSKASNSEFIVNLGDWFGLKYAITYFYNVYGDREISSGSYATVIAIYREAMQRNTPLKVVLPGVQVRNFTHVSDIVEGLYLVALYGEGDEYGIGHNREWRIQEVAELFGGEIEHVPERRGNRLSGMLVTQKTRELGWSPKVELEEYVNQLRESGWS